MMKRVLTMLMVALTVPTAFAQTEWTFDKVHSAIVFEIDHMGVSRSMGEFKDFVVTLNAPKPVDLNGAKCTVTIQASSVDTKDANRDEHVRGADFFEVAKYPTITITDATFSVMKGGDNEYAVNGMMTMHGETKAVSFVAKASEPVQDPWGKSRIGITISGSIDRAEFGMDTYLEEKLDNGEPLLGRIIDFRCSMEFTK